MVCLENSTDQTSVSRTVQGHRRRKSSTRYSQELQEIRSDFDADESLGLWNPVKSASTLRRNIGSSAIARAIQLLQGILQISRLCRIVTPGLIINSRITQK